MMELFTFSILEWPEMFRPTEDNMQDMLKWFLKNNGRQDLILEMTEREAAFLKKELAPDYSLVGDWGNRAMASINRHLDTFVNIKQVYMYLGIRIYITVKAEVRNES
jgi:hypothetical protein